MFFQAPRHGIAAGILLLAACGRRATHVNGALADLPRTSAQECQDEYEIPDRRQRWLLWLPSKLSDLAVRTRRSAGATPN